MKRKTLFVIALVALVSAAQATTWYVDGTNGSDSNAGTSVSSAKHTIQAAINAASSYDTVIVAAGTYSPISVNKRLTIQGAGADKTVIDGGNSARCATFSATDGYILKNVKLQNGYSGYANGGGAYYGTLYDCVITNCKTYNNSNDYSGAGAFQSTLYNCTVTGNVNTRSCGAGGLDYCYANNCIVYGNSNTAGYSSYGNYYNMQSTSYCYTSDPKFSDAANGDYRLASNSPCIDEGYNYSSIGDTDLDGHARIINGRVDIGCYEYIRLFSVAANSTPLANTYKLSWELAEGAEEGVLRLDADKSGTPIATYATGL